MYKVDRYCGYEGAENHRFYGMYKVVNESETVQGIFYTEETASNYRDFLNERYIEKHRDLICNCKHPKRDHDPREGCFYSYNCDCTMSF